MGRRHRRRRARPARAAQRRWRSSPRPKSPSPRRCWTCCSRQDGEPRVPVLALIDSRLAIGETDGWHYDDLPEDGAGVAATRWPRSTTTRATALGRGFAELTPSAAGRADPGRAGRSRRRRRVARLPGVHVWSLWTRYACTAFYSHPWAWNEIGFAGPAYPRGYLNLGIDAREHMGGRRPRRHRPGAVRRAGSSRPRATTPTCSAGPAR